MIFKGKTQLNFNIFKSKPVSKLEKVVVNKIEDDLVPSIVCSLSNKIAAAHQFGIKLWSDNNHMKTKTSKTRISKTFVRCWVVSLGEISQQPICASYEKSTHMLLDIT